MNKYRRVPLLLRWLPMRVVARRRGYYDGRAAHYDCPYPPDRGNLTRAYRRGFREGSHDRDDADKPHGPPSPAAYLP